MSIWSTRLTLIVALLALVAAPLLAPTRASASSSQLAMIEDDVHVAGDPLATLTQFRLLGADVVRVSATWINYAPGPNARRRPVGFNGGDPAAYPPAVWRRLDGIVRAAHRVGLGVDVVLTGGAPRWAEGPGIPRAARGNPRRAWKPSAREFGAFVKAVATRYDGRYADPQNPGQALPRVSFWTIWNEPNFGHELAPQAAYGSTVPVGAMQYRNLADAAWSALNAAGHRGDTVLIGGLAPTGLLGPVTAAHPEGLPGNFAMTKPVLFIQALYCLDSSYRELRGLAAQLQGCPVSPAGSGRFRARNPVLFSATGFATHPYSGNVAPNAPPTSDPDFATFPDLPRLAQDLDRVQRTYGSRTRFPIYNDEFGYITNPPARTSALSPSTAAAYVNQAEYMSWRNGRIASMMQYLLFDPFPGAGNFATGLLTAWGRQKPAYASYRVPIFLPGTVARPGRRLEVWGCVRPAPYARIDTGLVQSVQVQFRAGSRGGFRTIKTVPITSARGYFDVRMAFPGSGTVRLAWSYPQTDPLLSPSGGGQIFSRNVRVTIT